MGTTVVEKYPEWAILGEGSFVKVGRSWYGLDSGGLVVSDLGSWIVALKETGKA